MWSFRLTYSSGSLVGIAESFWLRGGWFKSQSSLFFNRRTNWNHTRMTTPRCALVSFLWFHSAQEPRRCEVSSRAGSRESGQS